MWDNIDMESSLKNQFVRKHYYNEFKKSAIMLGEIFAIALLFVTAYLALFI